MKPTIKAILFSGIIAGTLDCIAAVVFLGKMNFAGVWKYVASGYFGNDAFTGGNEMVVYGLLFHFSIAMIWAIVYSLLFTKISFFTNNAIVGGLLYGVIIWLAMTFIVVPLTEVPPHAISIVGAAKNITILMLCVGLPISFIANRFKSL